MQWRLTSKRFSRAYWKVSPNEGKYIFLLYTCRPGTRLPRFFRLLTRQLDRRKNAPSEASIFQCVSMLSTAVGQALTKHMHNLLDLMFAYGLSRGLVDALDHLAKHIPPLLPTIQGEQSHRIALEDNERLMYNAPAREAVEPFVSDSWRRDVQESRCSTTATPFSSIYNSGYGDVECASLSFACTPGSIGIDCSH